ncbi:glycosyl hydrolase 115 family protein [Carboxylicivirga sp. M1479]|uniref:glycosyl hydrolase 115 family protein n=1 Tax=Carboxylicivirga sp. M1479 TaxID=2594476 RepID=UPI00117778F2|nr:glycosyl hydrolase 115 family protein [Carboxylicivirga sp. M1479]TRX71082.1 hypothetical protein FNN09_08715 [Carboxylicivirga sp. M1479]
MSKFIFSIIVSLLTMLISCSQPASQLSVLEKASSSTFPLVGERQEASLIIDSSDYAVVKTAVRHFSDDVKLLTGQEPDIHFTNTPSSEYVLIIGTIGKSALIDELIEKKKLNVEAIEGQWESYLIDVLDQPLPGIKKAMVIAGSDRRGTAYGVFTISETMGVSPWYWWADVVPNKKDEIHVIAKNYIQKSPSVKYRGIFINDEGFGGLNVWARKTYETDIKDIGPKTYARVFELLLRLKANYCWPAMHACTKPFYYYPENPVVADNYGIVIGTSHCEQMHCNTMTEWDVKKKGPWNYKINADTINAFWTDRIELTKNYENTFTLGMRGTEDIEMEGAESVEEMVEITQQAIDKQRQLLAISIDEEIEDIPQVLCTYKEVLVTYQNGLEVPDDVTLLWADDNHGYTRQLCTPEEQQRSGGSGVYYHLSLLGTPEAYLWLNTISPSLIAYEMTKAYEYGADRIWMFNIGDIKPHEKEMTMALEMAWDINKWTPDNAHLFTLEWAERTFGSPAAKGIAELMEEYYVLAAAGKPEHSYRLDYSMQELNERIERYRILSQKAIELKAQLPESLMSAYYQLVEYPILGCRWMNERNLLARRSLIKASQKDRSALLDGEKALVCHDQLDSITNYYNHVNAGGKWKHIMKWNPWMTAKMPSIATEELLEKVEASPNAHTIDLKAIRLEAPLTIKDEVLMNTHKLGNEEIHGTYQWQSEKAGQLPIWIFATIPTTYEPSYSLAINEQMLRLPLKHIGNIWHTQVAAPIWYEMGNFNIVKGQNTLQLSLPDSLLNIAGIHIGYYPPIRQVYKQQIPAQNFVRKGKGAHSHISKVKGLGMGVGVSTLPFTAPSLTNKQLSDAAWVEYEMNWPKGSSHIEIRTLPTQRIHEGRGVRYAVSVNNEESIFYDVQADEFTAEWQDNVIRGFTKRKINYQSKDDDKVTLRLYLLDPGVIVRDIVIY